MDLESYIESQRDLFIQLSDRIWELAETRFEEHQSIAQLINAFEQEGFTISREIGDIPTAFMASYGTEGPIIALLGEYDALAGLSQAAVPYREEVVAMAHRGIDLHLEEVMACHSNLSDDALNIWRKGGERANFPPPDGFPNIGTHIPPETKSGPITWSEAWAIARPWFVDPDAPSFSMQTIHPDQWFH